MTFGETLKDKNSWKLHCLIFPALLFGAFYMFYENVDWGLRCVIQSNCYYVKGEPTQGIFDLYIPSIDDKIPILSGFIVVYALAIAAWLIMPVVIYCLYGKKQFAKFLGISSLVFITNLLIGACFYTNSYEVESYGIQTLKGFSSLDWFQQQNLHTLQTCSMFGCFPSNHCTCSLLLMYAFIDFGFFNQKHDVKSKRFIAKCILIPLFSVYSLCVCFSTMTLKIHYFVDFCAALGICTFWWTICSIFKKVNILQKPYIMAAVNFEVTFGYLSKKAVEWKDYMTTCLKSSLPDKVLKYSKKQFITHFALSDFLCIVVFGISVAWWILWGTIIQFPNDKDTTAINQLLRITSIC